MSKNIQILKLTTGDELIAEVIVESPKPGVEIIKLVKPCEVQRIDMPDGSVNARFAPVAIYVKDHTVVLANSHVVYVGEPEDGFAQAYNQLVDPNAIALPPEKKLVLPQ